MSEKSKREEALDVLRQFAQENPEAVARAALNAKLALGLDNPQILDESERLMLEQIKNEDPERYADLQRAAVFGRCPPTAREHCSRMVPFITAVIAFGVAFLLAWVSGGNFWVGIIYGPLAFYGILNLKDAVFASQEELDKTFNWSRDNNRRRFR